MRLLVTFIVGLVSIGVFMQCADLQSRRANQIRLEAEMEKTIRELDRYRRQYSIIADPLMRTLKDHTTRTLTNDLIDIKAAKDRRLTNRQYEFYVEFVNPYPLEENENEL